MRGREGLAAVLLFGCGTPTGPTPVTRLAVGADHSQTRARLLRYTTPFSLAGVPVVTIPGKRGGMQLAAAPGSDEPLLELAARLGAQRKPAVPAPTA